MNRQKYMAELAGLISFLTEEDRRTVMDYYERKFDAAGESGEAALMAELGTPMRLAININRLGLEEMLKEPEPEPEVETVEAEEEVPAEEPESVEEAPVDEEAPAEETAAVEEEAPLEEPEAEEAEEVPEEHQETARLIAAVLAEPDPEPEENAAEESQVTDEIEELELPAGEEKAEEPAPVEEKPEEPEHTHHESFPELTVAKGKTIPDAEKQPETRFSILGAIGFFILAVVPGIPLLAVSIVLLPLVLIPGIVLGWCGAVAGVAGFKCLVYIPDAMFMFGAALVLLGLAVLLMMLALWIDKSIICAWKNGVPGLWKRLTRKERA